MGRRVAAAGAPDGACRHGRRGRRCWPTWSPSSAARPRPDGKDDRDITVDEAVERFLVEHLVGEKGREASTTAHYRSVHGKWFSPEIGRRRLRNIDEATIDRIFGRTRRAGLSASRMNDARSLYAPLFRWAKRRRIVARSPMADF